MDFELTNQLPKKQDNPSKKHFNHHSLVEILLFLSLSSLLEHWLNNEITGWLGTSSISMAHPFVIAIWVFGLAYGYQKSFFTLLGTLGILLLTNRNLISNPLEWSADQFLPWAMVFSSILSGAIHHLFVERNNLLTKSNKELSDRINELDSLNIELLASNLRLEKKIVSRYETFQTLFEVSERLNKLHLNEIYDTIPELLINVFNAEKASLFLVQEDNHLILRSKAGWNDFENYPTTYNTQSAFHQLISNHLNQQVLGPLELGEECKDGLIVIPILDDSNLLSGIIKVESLKVQEITSANLNLLKLLSKWINRSIRNAISYSDYHTHQMYDPATGLLTEDYFWRFLQKNVTRAVRNQYDIVVAIYQFHFSKDATEDGIQTVLLELAGLIQHNFRHDDELAKADSAHEYQFLVSMLYTSIEDSDIPVKRLDKQFKQYNRKLGKELKFKVSLEHVSLMDGSLFINNTINEKLQITTW